MDDFSVFESDFVRYISYITGVDKRQGEEPS